MEEAICTPERRQNLRSRPLANIIGIAKQILYSRADNPQKRIGTWLDLNR